MKQDFEVRFDDILRSKPNNPLCWAMLLDPSRATVLRDLWTKDTRKECYEEVRKASLDLAIRAEKLVSLATAVQLEVLPIAPATPKRKPAVVDMVTPPEKVGVDNADNAPSDDDGDPNADGTTFHLSSVINNEIDLYISKFKIFSKPGHEVNDPLLWWRENSNTLPNLARLARKWLSIPASSTPSERVFSIAGLMDTAKRQSLSPRKLGEQVLIHNNYDTMLPFHGKLDTYTIENYNKRKHKEPVKDTMEIV